MKRGLSIRALADEIGISHMTLLRVESGTTNPDYYTQENIKKWLKTGKDQDAPARRSYNNRVENLEGRVLKLEEKVFKGKKKP